MLFDPIRRNALLAGVLCGLFYAAPCARAERNIVLPENPSPTVQFAAGELQRYVRQMTGETWPVQLAGASMPDARAVYVGVAPASGAYEALRDIQPRTLAHDSYGLYPQEGDLFLIGGGDRGTLYAVYEFLEIQGCRWLEPGPDGDVIPARDALVFPEQAIERRAVFAVREIDRGAATPAEAEQVIDWAVKNRLNRIFNLRSHPAWHKRGGQVLWQHICHNSPWLIPNDPWFDTHPEMFSLFNGRRIPQAKEGGYLCTTNPRTQQQAADFIIRWFDRHPEGDAVPVSPPDGDVKWCECEACKSLGGVNFDPGPLGHMTRRQVEFINAIADLVAEKHPDRYIVNLAYSRYVWPYEGMRTAPNVINQVAHGYAGNGSLVHSIQSTWNDDARDIFETWAASGGAGIGLWDYFILHVPDQSGSAMTPLGFAGVATDMVQYLAKFTNPYKVYFTQAGAELHRFNGFLYYAIARMVWDPAQELEQVRKDYAEARFGAAGDVIAGFYRKLDEAYAVADWNPPIWRDITVPSARVFTPEVVRDGWERLHRARKILADGTPAQQQALDRLITSWHYVETTVLPKQLMAEADGVWRLIRGDDAYVFNPGAPPGHEENWARMYARAVEEGLMDASMERVLFRARSREERMVWLENDRIQLAVLPGVGGRMIRLIDRSGSGNNLFYEPHTLTELKDPGATYFRYGGYEEYTREAFASPGWELAMEPVVSETDEHVELKLEAVTPEQVQMQRVIRLEKGNSAQVTIHSRLTNQGPVPFHAMIRVHPEFQLTGQLQDTVVFMKDAEGSYQALRAPSVAGADDLSPDGEWGILDAASGSGLVMRYAPVDTTAHVHLDRAYQTLNLELFGQRITLAKGESVELQQTWRLIGGPDEMPPSLRQEWERQQQVEENPWRGVEVVPGFRGQGIRLSPHATPTWNGWTRALSHAGAFHVWMALDGDPATTADAILMSAGTKQPDYMVLAIREGRLVFYRQQSQSDGQGFNAWLKVDVELPDWTPGSWHHVGVQWQDETAGGPLVELFVDGLSATQRRDMRMAPFIQTMQMALGWNSASAARPRFPGVMDQVLLLAEPLAPGEVKRLVEHMGNKGVLSLDKAPLLFLDFEGMKP